MNWQSSNLNPPTRKRATNETSAILEASRLMLNMDSPKKAPSIATP
jgi:hypothetical protein